MIWPRPHSCKVGKATLESRTTQAPRSLAPTASHTEAALLFSFPLRTIRPSLELRVGWAAWPWQAPSGTWALSTAPQWGHQGLWQGKYPARHWASARVGTAVWGRIRSVAYGHLLAQRGCPEHLPAKASPCAPHPPNQNVADGAGLAPSFYNWGN